MQTELCKVPAKTSDDHQAPSSEPKEDLHSMTAPFRALSQSQSFENQRKALHVREGLCFGTILARHVMTSLLPVKLQDLRMAERERERELTYPVQKKS